MKQKNLLLLFALWPLFAVSSKQIFASGLESFPAQDEAPTITTETAVSMAQRINDHRRELGLPAYTYNDSLAQGAQWVTDTMAANEFISHYDDNGANPQQRADRAGYNAHVTEIIFGGFGGADAAWDWWSERELHESLITSEDYTEFGVALTVGAESGRAYWAVMFGKGDGENESAASGSSVTPGPVTKLPPTSTAVITAVNTPPTATSSPDPTATSEYSNSDDEAYPANPSSGESTDGNASNNNGTALGGATLENPPWLIIAAVFTIIFSIAVFYFPRLGLSQKFKERT
jgi:uncharacterized protein YkwD